MTFLPPKYKSPTDWKERMENHYNNWQGCDHRSPDPNANRCSNCSRDYYQYMSIKEWATKTGLLETPVFDKDLAY